MKIWGEVYHLHDCIKDYCVDSLLVNSSFVNGCNCNYKNKVCSFFKQIQSVVQLINKVSSNVSRSL